jgi:hypothetical protein
VKLIRARRSVSFFKMKPALGRRDASVIAGSQEVSGLPDDAINAIPSPISTAPSSRARIKPSR